MKHMNHRADQRKNEAVSQKMDTEETTKIDGGVTMERMTEKGPNEYFIRLVKNGAPAHKINIVEDESVCEEILADPLSELRKTVQMPVPRMEGDIVERLAEYENTGMSPRQIIALICGKDIIREVSTSEINQAFEDGYRKAMNEVSNG